MPLRTDDAWVRLFAAFDDVTTRNCLQPGLARDLTEAPRDARRSGVPSGMALGLRRTAVPSAWIFRENAQKQASWRTFRRGATRRIGPATWQPARDSRSGIGRSSRRFRRVRGSIHREFSYAVPLRRTRSKHEPSMLTLRPRTVTPQHSDAPFGVGRSGHGLRGAAPSSTGRQRVALHGLQDPVASSNIAEHSNGYFVVILWRKLAAILSNELANFDRSRIPTSKELYLALSPAPCASHVAQAGRRVMARSLALGLDPRPSR